MNPIVSKLQEYLNSNRKIKINLDGQDYKIIPDRIEENYLYCRQGSDVEIVEIARIIAVGPVQNESESNGKELLLD